MLATQFNERRKSSNSSERNGPLTISHILKFKIENSYKHKKVPYKLIRLAAHFLKDEQISLENILVSLDY